MIGAKQFDPVLGLDVHIYTIPPAPPAPFPQPHIGVVFDPFDFIPFFGTVSINGVPRATAGSGGYAIPHPILGAPVPAPPSNDHENLTGSMTVIADGDPLSRLGDLVLSCWSVGILSMPRLKVKTKPKNLLMPTSVLLAVPMGPPVLVGGPPMVSLFSLAFKLVGPLLKGLRKLAAKSSKFDNLMRGLSSFLRRKTDDLLSAVGRRVGADLSAAARRVSDTICEWTGHPVEPVTGLVKSAAVDFELPGRWPFTFARAWYSSSGHRGDLGHGWHHAFDLALYASRDLLVVRLGDGRYVPFGHPGPGRPWFSPAEKLWLHVDHGGWFLEDPQGRRSRFGEALPPRSLPALPAPPLARPLTRVEDLNGNAVRIERDDQGTLRGFVDTAGRRLRVEGDPQGRIHRVLAPDPDEPAVERALLRCTYDPGGDLVEVVGPTGHATSYRYQDHLLVAEVDATGHTFHFAWHGVGPRARCVRTWGDGGLYPRELQYDDEAQVTTVRESRGVTVYRWDTRGFVHTRVDPRGGAWRKAFDADNNLVEATNPLGQVTKLAWDPAGRLLAHTDAAGARTTWTYDAAGNLASETDALGGTHRYAWDARRNLVAYTDPLGHRTQFEVDAFGRVVRVEDPLGAVSELAWDRAHNRVWARDRSRAWTSWRHDGWGRVRRIEDAEGGITRLEYDARGRVVRFDDPGGRTWRYTWSAGGDLVTLQDPLGRTLRMGYGPLGRLRSVEEPDGRRRHYEYDLEQDLVAVRDAAGGRWSFQRDAAGGVVAERTADGRDVRYTLDAAGRIGSVTSPSGSVETYVRDAVGRLVQVSWGSGRVERLAWDPLGRLVAATTPEAAASWAYDARGREVSAKVDGVETHYAWDAEGRLVRRETPQGVVDYAYDPEGRATSIRAGAHVVELTYDALGRETVRRQPGGTVAERTWLPTGELAQSSVSRGSLPVVQRRYAYDGAGALIRVDRGALGTTELRYDACGRLAEATLPDQTVATYPRDPAGNVLGVPHGPPGPDGFHRLRVPRAGTDLDPFDLVNDRDGQLVEKLEDEARWQYTYDEPGRLVRLTRTAGRHPTSSVGPVPVGWEFAYDALHRPVRAEVADSEGGRTELEWSWDHDVLLGERARRVGRDGAELGRTATEYVFEPDGWAPLLILGDGAGVIACDPIGAPTAALDFAGQVVWTAGALPWGERASGETGRVPFGFPGQVHLAGTGILYSRFRWYHPELRRFHGPDPLGVDGGLHPWNYVDAPYALIDPLGLACYSARVVPGQPVQIGRRLTEEQAIRRVRRGGDVFADTSTEARRIAKGGSGGQPIHDAPHGRDPNDPNYLPHYHTPQRRHDAHVFYPRS